MPLVVRPVLPADHAAVGELTSRTYLNEGWADPGYARSLLDVQARIGSAQVLVAVDADLVGAVTLVTAGGAIAEQGRPAEPGEAVIRHLVTAPEARGHGVGAALVGACLDLARQDGCRLVRLSTDPRMAAAQRLYERLGFVRQPDRDWSPAPGVELLAYALALVPFCDQCGEDLLAAEHLRCAALRRLDPPRWCPHCRRRMVVQVTPTGWSARCVEHGTTTAQTG